ncbi:transposase [Mesorhizobium sp.]|uniref:IS66-like element accessory protein TnpA n=1 Tax=Mesorhizobium sp. TaxID=1871066 RepID=UPI0025CD8811|nr:transposase [Mesorhizobium sp.]
MEWDDPDASHQDSHQGRHEEGRYRRIEVITGRRRRRNWTPAEKARVVAESAESGANISAVARHWGVSRGLLSVWRRQAGAGEGGCGDDVSPAVCANYDRGRGPAGRARRRREARVPTSAGRIELEIGESRLVLTGSVDPTLAAAIVDALRVRR